MQMFRIAALFGVTLFLCSISFAQQKIEKCLLPTGVGGKYKLFVASRPLETNKEILLQVIVKPKNFTKDYMTKFAERVKSEYCNEEIIAVNIFDSKKSLLGWHYDYVVTGGKVDRRRGTYLLDKRKSEEAIEFSAKPGNPINEVRIELSEFHP